MKKTYKKPITKIVEPQEIMQGVVVSSIPSDNNYNLIRRNDDLFDDDATAVSAGSTSDMGQTHSVSLWDETDEELNME